MQTFLPYSDFARSAQSLDRLRLGKQRIEVIQLLNVLMGHRTGWANHPATRMWRGHEMALAAYGVIMCREWTGRGYQDTCEAKIARLVNREADELIAAVQDGSLTLPAWMGDEEFHRSHQGRLVAKDPTWYSERFDAEPLDDVIWPM